MMSSKPKMQVRNVYKVLADASLPELELAFPPPFQLTLYHNLETLQAALPYHDILLCRSTLKVNASLLQEHALKYVLTASSGRDHLDETYLESQHINIIDAKGTNANAVVDYVLANLSYLALFHDFHPQTIGIIGCGEVGRRLYQRLQTHHFRILTYDPLNKGPHHTELQTLAQCDLLCIHANLHDGPRYPSRYLIEHNLLKQRHPHQAIINASRGSIVDEHALLQAHQGLYCTDVFSNEPQINAAVVQHATLCSPHIAGHSMEAKKDALRQISISLHCKLNLTPPCFPPHPQQTFQKTFKSWQETMLSIYNPMIDTQALKASQNLQDIFIQQRRNHLRHGSEYYSLPK